LKIEDKAVS